MPPSSQPSRTLRAATRCPSGILDRCCGRRPTGSCRDEERPSPGRTKNLGKMRDASEQAGTRSRTAQARNRQGGTTNGPRKNLAGPGRSEPHAGAQHTTPSPRALAVARTRSESQRSSPRTQGGSQTASGDPRTGPIHRTFHTRGTGPRGRKNGLVFGGQFGIRGDLPPPTRLRLCPRTLSVPTAARTLAACSHAHRATALHAASVGSDRETGGGINGGSSSPSLANAAAGKATPCANTGLRSR